MPKGVYPRPARQPIADRFWQHVNKTDSCWNWTGCTYKDGYGMFMVETYPRSVLRRSHRVAWELTNGPIPHGMQLLHHCDNRICVRPDHLFVGTQLDNMRDMIAKGRHGSHTMKLRQFQAS